MGETISERELRRKGRILVEILKAMEEEEKGRFL